MIGGLGYKRGRACLGASPCDYAQWIMGGTGGGLPKPESLATRRRVTSSANLPTNSNRIICFDRSPPALLGVRLSSEFFVTGAGAFRHTRTHLVHHDVLLHDGSDTPALERRMNPGGNPSELAGPGAVA